MSYLDPLDAPNLNVRQVHRFVTDDVGFLMKKQEIDTAVAQGQLQCIRGAGSRGNRFSRRMVLTWLEHLSVAVDWDRARTEAARQRVQAVQRELTNVDAQLTELGASR